MSLAAPEESSVEAAFVCNKSESVLSVIEKCLDNGLGSCLVVGDDHRFIGRISLDDIRRALADGTAIVDPTLGWHPEPKRHAEVPTEGAYATMAHSPSTAMADRALR